VILSRTATVLAAVLASLPVTSPLTADRAIPRDGASHALRKDRAPAAEEPAAIATLGTLYNTHSFELTPLSETEPSAERFSDLLADKALLAKIDLAPELLALLRTIARAHPGVRIDIVSGYRSKKRNEMMRKKGRHVASHSQHTMGHAVDFRVEGMSVGDMVKEVEALRWKGGLGRYDSKSDRFVHVDVGPDRRWKGK